MGKFNNALFLIAFSLILTVGCHSFEVEYAPLPNPSPSLTRGSDGDFDMDVHLSDVERYVALCYPGRSFQIQPLSVASDTLLFVCNFEKGWVVISGDKRTSPVLAEDTIGTLDLKEAPDGIFTWIDSTAEDIWYFKQEAPYIENNNVVLWNLISTSIKTGNCITKSGQDFKWCVVDSAPVVTTTGYDFVPHLITTKWGQGTPWNAKCPIDTKNSKRCYLGCVATAVAQFLLYTHTYLSKPNRLYHDISCSKATVYGKTYDIGFSRSTLVENSARWSSMPIDSSGYSLGVSYAGDLMLDIGNRFGMYYSGSGSGANIISYAMSNYYDLSYSYGNYDAYYVSNNVYEDMPVIVTAFSERGFLGIGYKSGHAWLIDGAYLSTTQYRYTKSFVYTENWGGHAEVYDTFEEIQAIYGVQYPSDTVERTVSVNNTYWLMNWGYDGSFDNGHYSMGVSDEWNANGKTHLYERKIYYDFY